MLSRDDNAFLSGFFFYLLFKLFVVVDIQSCDCGDNGSKRGGLLVLMAGHCRWYKVVLVAVVVAFLNIIMSAENQPDSYNQASTCAFGCQK